MTRLINLLRIHETKPPPNVDDSFFQWPVAGTEDETGRSTVS